MMSSTLSEFPLPSFFFPVTASSQPVQATEEVQARHHLFLKPTEPALPPRGGSGRGRGLILGGAQAAGGACALAGRGGRVRRVSWPWGAARCLPVRRRRVSGAAFRERAPEVLAGAGEEARDGGGGCPGSPGAARPGRGSEAGAEPCAAAVRDQRASQTVLLAGPLALHPAGRGVVFLRVPFALTG